MKDREVGGGVVVKVFQRTSGFQCVTRLLSQEGSHTKVVSQQLTTACFLVSYTDSNRAFVLTTTMFFTPRVDLSHLACGFSVA